jgi:ferritin-like metal-binding protein YciE
MAWLNNAYAMEVDLVKTLEGQLPDAKDYPDVEMGIKDHLEKTKGHAEKIKRVIEKNGGDVSAIKAGAGAVMGMMKGISTKMMHDKIVTNLIMDYAAEHFEMATYRTLIAAANEVGDEESVPVFEEILEDEKEMEEKIEKAEPMVVKQFLSTHEE